MSTASEVTVLLMLEAIDKASRVIEGITGKLDRLGEQAKSAAEKASMTGEELEAAQVKAEAAANAYTAAVAEQEAAQARLLASTQAVRDAQAAAAEAAQAQVAAQETAAAALGVSADEMLAKYGQLAEAAAADARAAEASAAKITELEGKLAAVHGAAADSVQAALDREKASYAQLAVAAQESSAAVAAAFTESDAKILAGYQEQAVAAGEAAASAKAAAAQQIAALDGLSTAQKAVTKRSAEMAAAQDAASTSVAGSGAALKGAKVAAGLTAAAVAGIGYESVKAAANFQQATTVLQTSGGETAAQMAAVRAGILSIASSTGTEIQELTNGMYMIGSAGFTGAKGLVVLTAAAQGAKAENADLGTVSNALTTILKDYGRGADQATASMDQMIAVVQNGKTTTEALAGSLSNVLPIAAAAKLSFDQVGGAMATMTGEGMSAQQAAQDLANTIRSLQNPNSVAINEMAQMGLNANQVSQQLGKKGLTGTLEELTAAITQHMGPSGQVVMSTFQQAKSAAADADAEIKAMPAGLQKLATEFLNGSVTAKQWRTDLQGLDPVSAHLLTQFAGTAEKAHSFNSLLSSGSPAAQTYSAALSKMLGGATGLNTALMLTGGNMGTFQSNVAAVGEAGKAAGKDVNGWAEIQSNMNQKLAELKLSAEAAGIQLGTALLPMVTKVLDAVLKVVTPIADWIAHNKTLAAVILLVVGALATGITVFIMVGKAILLMRDAMLAFEMVTEGLEFNPIILAITSLAVVALLIVTHWSTVKKWIGDFFGWMKTAFNDAKAFVAKWWPELAAPITGGLSLLVKFVMDHWNAISGFLRKAWGDLVGIWSATGGKAVTAVKAAFDWVSGEVKRASGAMSAVLATAWGDLVNLWNSTGGAAVTAISQAWDEATGAISDEWAKISGDLESIWGSLVEIWNGTGGKLVSLISDNWGTIESIFRGAIRLIVDFVKPQLEALEAIFRFVFNAVSSLVRTQWALITGIFRTALGLIETGVQAGVQTIEMIFSLAWDVIKTVVAAAWDAIRGVVMAGVDVVEGIIRAAWDVLVGLFRAVWDLLTAIINTALDSIKDTLKLFADLVTGKWGKLWGDVKKIFTDAWNNVYGFFKSILNDINKTVTGAVSSIFGGFEKGIKSAVSGVTKALQDVYNGVVGFFKDAGTWLYNIGKSILSGLVNGAKSALGDVKNFFTSIAGDIVSWKGPPSYDAVMLTGNGQLIMKGLITGIDSQTDALRAKLGSISATIKADAVGPQNLGQAFASGLGGAASLGTTGSSGPVVNQTFSGNYLMTDADMTKFANFVGGKVVTHIAPQGGNKILMR